MGSIAKTVQSMPPRMRAAVERELNCILESESFRESRRCQEFLRCVVTLALEGRQDEIKERAIGIDVFGRSPDYSTNDDSIVRVKASEVRRRLAQYHQLRGGDHQVRIEIPSGAYVPEFTWISAPPQEEAPPVPSPPPVRKPYLWVAAAILAVAAAGAFLALRPQHGGNHRFWEPVLRGKDPVLICLGHPVVYLLSKRVHDRYKAERGVPEPGPYVVELKSGAVPATDIVPVPDQFVGVGDALAAVQISNLLTRHGRLSQTRIGNDVSFSEFRNSAVVLIGAFSNRWTMQLNNELRFVFDRQNDRKVIRDRVSGKTWEPPFISPGGRVTEDFAIVSRVFDAKSGQMVVTAAGITQYGCQAAAEFLSRPENLDRAVKGLPAGWEKKNVQFVIRTKVMGAAVSAPEVLAMHAG